MSAKARLEELLAEIAQTIEQLERFSPDAGQTFMLETLHEWQRRYSPADDKPAGRPGPLPDQAVLLAVERLRDIERCISLNQTSERLGGGKDIRSQIRNAVRDHKTVAAILLGLEKRNEARPGWEGRLPDPSDLPPEEVAKNLKAYPNK